MIYTVREVAEILKVNRNYVYKLIDMKILPAIKLGSWKVRKEALDKFLESYEGYDLTDLNNLYKY